MGNAVVRGLQPDRGRQHPGTLLRRADGGTAAGQVAGVRRWPCARGAGGMRQSAPACAVRVTSPPQQPGPRQGVVHWGRGNGGRTGGGGGHANGTSCHIQHSPNTPTTGLRERGNNTSKSTGRSGRQNAATRRNMRREDRVTVQGPVKEQQPDGMSHRGRGRLVWCALRHWGVPRGSSLTVPRLRARDRAASWRRHGARWSLKGPGGGGLQRFPGAWGMGKRWGAQMGRCTQRRGVGMTSAWIAARSRRRPLASRRLPLSFHRTLSLRGQRCKGSGQGEGRRRCRDLSGDVRLMGRVAGDPEIPSNKADWQRSTLQPATHSPVSSLDRSVPCPNPKPIPGRPPRPAVPRLTTVDVPGAY